MPAEEMKLGSTSETEMRAPGDAQPLLDFKKSSERIDVLGVNVINDDYLGDMVWIFPIKMSEEARMRQKCDAQTASDLPKCDGVSAAWETVYKKDDCMNMASAIFQADRPKTKSEELPTSRARLQEDFWKDMTRLEFHGKVMERCADLLTGNRVSLKLNTCLSADHDEVFYCFGTENHSEIVKLIANSEGYRAEVRGNAYPVATSRDAANSAGPDGRLAVPHIDDGAGARPAPGWTTYEMENEHLFCDFRSVDKLRMIKRRISHFISPVALERYGVIVKSFVVHKYRDVQALASPEANFGRPNQWWRMPAYRLDQAKDYFGEELAFFFHWFRFYTVQLIIPALVGCLLLSRRAMLDHTQQRLVQDCFCLFMALWAAQFCENYNRSAIVQAALWGTRNYDNVAAIRPGYQEQDEADRKATRWTVLGASIMSTFLALIIGGIATIQSVRYVMVHHPTDNPITSTIISFTGDEATAVKLGAKIGAMMITMQVKFLDIVWGKIAKVVTDRENHKTESRYQSSLVFKVVMVKFFNAMYPFLYVAFAKEYIEGCSGPAGSCIFALETCITTFFVVHLGVTFALLTKRIVTARLAIRQEMTKPGIDSANYTYLQVQAKTDAFSSAAMLDDYMELTVQFAMVTCFSVVLPALTVLALLSNMIEFRVIAYRQLFVVQRVYPSGAENIGAWQSIFAAIATMAVIVNAGLGVFAMSPFRELDAQTKLCGFLIFEHVLIFAKILVEVAIPDLPAQVDKAEDKQEVAIQKMFGGGFKPVHVENKSLPTKGDLALVGADGDALTSSTGGGRYTPFHLSQAGKTAAQPKAAGLTAVKAPPAKAAGAK
ncbi:unnamed protein product [Amoebophrya sp. A25]|nr:unnamed protein product [Amoebophrya sp. A25]|eukprot:GSA25T00016047001.1